MPDPIRVRTRDDSHLLALQEAGATEVVPQVLESSLILAAHALTMLGFPEQQVQEHIDVVRRGRYRLLYGYYHGAQANLLDKQGQQRLLMHAVNLSESAYACGRPLNELALERLGVEVQAPRWRRVDVNPQHLPQRR